MMSLRKPCEVHGRYETHLVPGPDDESWWCDGGDFLPADVLVIERDDPRLLSAWMDWTGLGMLELKYFLGALFGD